MRCFLITAAVGVLALVVQGDTASAQVPGDPTQAPKKDRAVPAKKGRALPQSLRNRSLPRGARFTRYHYSARYRCWFCFTQKRWCYWYAPFRCYLSTRLIATYPPTAVVPPAATPPVVAAPATPPVVAP